MMVTSKILIVVTTEIGDRGVRNINGCDGQNIRGGGKQNR